VNEDVGMADPSNRLFASLLTPVSVMCQLTFAMFDKERFVEEIEDPKPESTANGVSENNVEDANSMQQKNRKTAKDALGGDRRSKKVRDEHFLFRNIHYHREILVQKRVSAPSLPATETHRKFGIDELPPLHQAAAKASLKGITKLLAEGMDVDEKIPFSMESEDFQFHGASPLLIAAWFGRTKAIDFLLEHGANINSVDSDNGGILEYAMWGPCRGRIVMQLLSYGADPNIRNRWGSLPLHVAAKHGLYLLIHPLLEAGNDINDRDNSGSTAVEIASDYGHEQVVQALLDLGADTTICENICQWNPLHAASYNGSEAIVEILLQEAPNLMDPDIDGDTPLHLAALKNHVGAARFLLAGGADITARNKSRQTSLHYVSATGGFETAKLLIEYGADISALAMMDQSPLHEAACGGHNDIVMLLLDHGAEINACDKRGATALHVACYNAKETVVEQLLASGAQSVKDKDDRLPLHDAILANCREPIVRLLLQHFPDSMTAKLIDGRTALHLAASTGNLPVFNLLLENGADTDVKNDVGETPLNYAVYYGSEPIVQLLLQQSLQEVKTRANDGESLLHYAVRGGHLSMMDLLLMTEPTLLEEDDNNGRTALFLAVFLGKKDIIEFLLHHGCQITLRDINGGAPWDLVEEKLPTFEILDLFITHGWDIDERYFKGRTPFHRAVIGGDEEAARFLISRGCHVDIGDDDEDTPLDTAIMWGNVNMQTLIREALETKKSTSLGPTVPETGASKPTHPTTKSLEIC
jgi:ankyrin repeat protein